jgi:hypothetical protein
LILLNNLAFAQKAKLSIYIQNGFYYEMPKLDEEKQRSIDANSISACDSLVGALKSEFLKESQTDTTTENWKLNSYFSFDYEDGIYSFAKIQKMKDTLVLGFKTFGVFKNQKCWILKQIPELSNIQTAIQTLKPDSFWAFYNSEPSGIKEIDAIKAKFKDTEGILDIDKLGAYLATKPKELEKYCDY